MDYSSPFSGAGDGTTSKDLPSDISAIAWDTSSNGVLGIATNENLRYYDTRINPSRPTLTRITNSRNAIQSIAFQKRRTRDRHESANPDMDGGFVMPGRMLAVEMNGAVRDLPLHQVAPVAISSRDGRISNSFGGTVWTGETTEGKGGKHFSI